MIATVWACGDDLASLNQLTAQQLLGSWDLTVTGACDDDVNDEIHLEVELTVEDVVMGEMGVLELEAGIRRDDTVTALEGRVDSSTGEFSMEQIDGGLELEGVVTRAGIMSGEWREPLPDFFCSGEFSGSKRS